MRCPRCDMMNPEGMKFCGGCGASLQEPAKLRCPDCGFENPPAFSFCGKCGSLLAPSQREPLEGRQQDGETPQGKASVIPRAERRQLTVMFCDLVGSTALSEALDPEDLRAVIQAYQAVSVKVVERFEGYVAQYLGDGILIYFGYPVAHEDEAERAVRAGLELLREIKRLGRELKQTIGKDLAVRIGMHTGMVVVGEVGSGSHREQLALGKTPNFAARLQSVAAPNTLVLSSTTCRLVKDIFEFEALGPQSLKGLSEAEVVYRVTGERIGSSPMDVIGPHSATALVGRERELELLVDRWGWVKQGSGQVVTICGESGMGKTHLIRAFKQELDVKSYTRLECRCLPYYQHSAFHPFIDLLRRMLGFAPEQSSDERLKLLAFLLERHGFADLQEAVPLFAALLSVPLGTSYAPLEKGPQVLKEKTRAALLHLLVSLAEERALLLIVEDLHWADPSTLELLDVVIDQGPTAPVMLLLTFDPVFDPPWQARTHVTPLTLPRLSHQHVEHLVDQVTGGKALPSDVLHQIISKTDGVPLFVEELTKMVLESGLLLDRGDHYELTGPLPPLAIPTSLHDSLMARLDRLATVKAVAQLAATLGREFSYAWIRAVSPLEEAALQQELGRLVDAELLYQRGLPPQATYVFKHALIQEEAYQSLLKSTRQQYHGRIARVLEEQFPETAEMHPELLAHHYAEAGLGKQAIPYWQRAGEKAMRQFAYAEATTHLRSALALLEELPENPARAEQELGLQVTLGTVLRTTEGFAAPEVEVVFERARELCEQAGETPNLFSVRRGLWAFHLLRARYATARPLAEQLLALAEHLKDPALLLEAHVALGLTCCWMGEQEQSRKHLEQGLALYDPQQHRAHAYRYGQDPGVAGRSVLAYVLWLLGDPDEGARQSRAALALAREIGHPFTLAYALQHAVLVAHGRGEVEPMREQAEALVRLTSEQGFAFWLASGTIFQGWVLVEQGHRKDGIARMREGLSAYEATGARLATTLWLALLAEGYGRDDQIEEGLALLERAQAVVSETGERIWEAELYRLKGDLLLRQDGHEAEAKQHFSEALEVARRQGARSWERKAAESLARLHERQHVGS